MSRAARLSGPTAVASNSAAPSTANEPDHTGSPAPRTAGSDSPVRFDSSSASPSADSTVPSATTWSPGRQAHQVADDDLLDRHAAVDPVAHDDRVRSDQRGEPVERALGADLLEGADRDVRDQDPEEQRVAPGRRR